MPNFTKAESELKIRLDKWLYFIKHLEDFQNIPAIFKEEVFEKAFEKAALANLVQADRDKYEMNLKGYRDYKNTIDTAFDEGKTEVAKKLKDKGMAIDFIIEVTGLSKEVIEKL